MQSLLVLALLACGETEAPIEAPAPPTIDAKPVGKAKLLPATRAALDTALETLTPCYESRRAVNPQLQGTWNLRLAILRDGTVKLEDIHGVDMTDLTLEDCIAAKVREWSLPTVPVSIPVRESVTFTPTVPKVTPHVAPGTDEAAEAEE